MSDIAEALRDAAQSLETIANGAGRIEGLEDISSVRGYANSRAQAAQEALSALSSSGQGELILDRLRHLTPGGSEFQTADECFTWIEHRLAIKPFSSGQGAEREAVRWFAGEMERKLSANDHKGGWAGCDCSYLLARLREEYEELVDAKTAEDVIDEAADVANFAMMLADKWRGVRPAAPASEKGETKSHPCAHGLRTTCEVCNRNYCGQRKVPYIEIEAPAKPAPSEQREEL